MGLDIKTYHFGYSTLHQLRQLALNYEGISIPIREFYDQNEFGTKFNEFIVHSDCGGLYISKSSKRYKKKKKEIQKRYGQLHCYFGDLDKLKQEVQDLHSYMLDNARGYLKDAWQKFYDDVMSARKILEFH